MPVYISVTTFLMEAWKKERTAQIRISCILFNSLCIDVYIYVYSTVNPHENLRPSNSW